MPLTSTQYVDLVYYNVSRGNPEAKTGLFRHAIQAELSIALRQLASGLMNHPDPQQRSLLHASFNYSLDATGSASLTTNPTVLPESVAKIDYTFLPGGTLPLVWVPFATDLDNPPDIGRDFVLPNGLYTIFNNIIKVKDVAGNIPTNGTVLAVVANFVPTIGQVPDSLARDLVQIGTMIAMSGMSVPPPAPPAPEPGSAGPGNLAPTH